MTDLELAQLRKDISDHAARLDRGEAQFALILLQQKETTMALCNLDASTRDICSIYAEMKATGRFSVRVRKFAFECIKTGGMLATLGYGVNWLLDFVKAHWP